MRRPRLKLNSEQEEAYYHCISRTAGEEWLLGDREKEVLRTQMWLVAQYCCVEILTYTLMSNHYHILLKVPKRRELDDTELLRLHNVLYPSLKPSQRNKLEAVKLDMPRNGAIAQDWREKQLRQKFDVSQFNKLLKMRFSIWYNYTHERFGTLWAERFKSLLIEEGKGLRNVAVYIELNCVRAHIVGDPKDYRFCGYAEAVAGNEQARRGLELLYGKNWREASEEHRCIMFAMLSDMKEQKAPIDPQTWEQVVKSQGKLPLGVVLSCKIRYFLDGVILGSETYVREKAAGLALRKTWKPTALLPVTDWTDLHVLSRMRTQLLG